MSRYLIPRECSRERMASRESATPADTSYRLIIGAALIMTENIYLVPELLISENIYQITLWRLRLLMHLKIV